MSTPDLTGGGACLGRPKTGRQIISLTPLIDVVFILLVFFMLTTSFMDLRTVQLTPPKIGAPMTKAAPPIVIELHDDGAWIGGDMLNGAALAARILKERQSAFTRPVVLRPAPGVAVQAVVKILDDLTLAQIDGVHLIQAVEP